MPAAGVTHFVPRTCEQTAALQPGLLLTDLPAGIHASCDLLERLAREKLTQRFLRKSVDLDEVTRAIEEPIGKA